VGFIAGRTGEPYTAPTSTICGYDFATQLADQGTRLDVISKLLGHSSLATAQRYAHVRDHLMRSAVVRLNAKVIAPSLPPARATFRA
jgi:integrase